MIPLTWDLPTSCTILLEYSFPSLFLLLSVHSVNTLWKPGTSWNPPSSDRLSERLSEAWTWSYIMETRKNKFKWNLVFVCVCVCECVCGVCVCVCVCMCVCVCDYIKRHFWCSYYLYNNYCTFITITSPNMHHVMSDSLTLCWFINSYRLHSHQSSTLRVM